MAEIKRRVDIVTIRPSGFTFRGKRFGVTPGCWIVSKAVAKEICKIYGYELPRCGYDRMLDSTGYNYVTNEANTFRISLHCVSCDVASTNRYA